MACDGILTARQSQVLRLTFDGLPQKAIAANLGISPKSVSNHMDAIYRKIRAHGQVLAVRWGVEHGYLPEIRNQHERAG